MQLLAESDDGYIPVSEFVSWPAMRSLCLPQVDAVASVCAGSSQLEVMDKGNGLLCVRSLALRSIASPSLGPMMGGLSDGLSGLSLNGLDDLSGGDTPPPSPVIKNALADLMRPGRQEALNEFSGRVPPSCLEIYLFAFLNQHYYYHSSTLLLPSSYSPFPQLPGAVPCSGPQLTVQPVP
jgi:hypothetical protein